MKTRKILSKFQLTLMPTNNVNVVLWALKRITNCKPTNFSRKPYARYALTSSKHFAAGLKHTICRTEYEIEQTQITNHHYLMLKPKKMKKNVNVKCVSSVGKLAT